MKHILLKSYIMKIFSNITKYLLKWDVVEFLLFHDYLCWWARDNTDATMWPCFQATKLLVIAFLLYSLWLLHLDTETLIFLECFLSLRLYYVVTLWLLRSEKIVACPALLFSYLSLSFHSYQAIFSFILNRYRTFLLSFPSYQDSSFLSFIS